jgi:hypothetical protein
MDYKEYREKIEGCTDIDEMERIQNEYIMEKIMYQQPIGKPKKVSSKLWIKELNKRLRNEHSIDR